MNLKEVRSASVIFSKRQGVFSPLPINSDYITINYPISQSSIEFECLFILIDTGKEGKHLRVSADDRYSPAVNGVNQLMMLLLLNHRAFMAAPLRSIKRALSSTSSALKWEGGVSMVQGASRGIGLEFVRIFSFPFRGFHGSLQFQSIICKCSYFSTTSCKKYHIIIQVKKEIEISDQISLTMETPL